MIAMIVPPQVLMRNGTTNINNVALLYFPSQDMQPDKESIPPRIPVSHFSNVSKRKFLSIFIQQAAK